MGEATSGTTRATRTETAAILRAVVPIDVANFALLKPYSSPLNRELRAEEASEMPNSAAEIPPSTGAAGGKNADAARRAAPTRPLAKLVTSKASAHQPASEYHGSSPPSPVPCGLTWSFCSLSAGLFCWSRSCCAFLAASWAAFAISAFRLSEAMVRAWDAAAAAVCASWPASSEDWRAEAAEARAL